jgi:hypothetical protein
MSKVRTTRTKKTEPIPRLDPTPQEIDAFREEVEQEFRRIQKERAARERSARSFKDGRKLAY